MGYPKYANQEFTRMPIKLKGLLVEAGITMKEYAAQIVQSRGHVKGKPLSMSAALHGINYGNWPKLTPLDEIKRQTEALLRRHHVPEELIATAFEMDEGDTYKYLHPVGSGSAANDATRPAAPAKITEETAMLLRAEALRQPTRKHFGLMINPFLDDIQSASDIFMWPDYRYAREALWDAARNGAFRGISGESGSGKTTLVEELRERIANDAHQIVLIEPYVVGMEATDRKGRQLKSAQIAEAVINALAPSMPLRQTPEGRFRQAHTLLKESARAGWRHLLLIEEAHALPMVTLKHLKRWRELKDGLRSLLGVALVGQPELEINLDERNPQVREVVQRCEIVRLLPLDNEVENYVAAKFQRVNADVARVFEKDFGDAIRKRLTFNGRGGGVSMLYPLAVNNLVCRAMNRAAEVGAERVDARIIAEA